MSELETTLADSQFFVYNFNSFLFLKDLTHPNKEYVYNISHPDINSKNNFTNNFLSGKRHIVKNFASVKNYLPHSIDADVMLWCEDHEYTRKTFSVPGIKRSPDANSYPISVLCKNATDFFDRVSEIEVTKTHIFYSHTIIPVVECLSKHWTWFGEKRNEIAYDFMSTTGRMKVANTVVNLQRMPKKSIDRHKVKPQNDYFIEFDFVASHIKLLLSLLKINLPADIDIYEFAGRYINQYDRDKVKKALLVELYGEGRGRFDKSPDIGKIIDFSRKLFLEYQRFGFVSLPISGRKIKLRGDDVTRGKLFAYYAQGHEMETYASKLVEIFNVLDGKKTGVALFNYDAVVFDVLHEERDILIDIVKILESGDLKVKHKIGRDFSFQK